MSPALRTRVILFGVALALVGLAEWVSYCGIGGGVHTSLQNYYRYGDGFFSACWLAGALAFASSRRSWRSLAIYVALGAACEMFVAHERAYRLYAGGSFGIVAMVIAAGEALWKRTEEAALLWFETVIFPALLLAAILPLDLTTYLHPTSLDGRMLLLERSLFGGQPAWIVGRMFDASSVFRGFETLVYVYLPTASGVVYLLERKARRGISADPNASPRPDDIQVAFITAGIIGIVLLQLAPVAGPTSFRPDYPDIVPSIDDALDQKLVAGMRWRNSIPSLHTTWSLLIYWHARPHGLRARIFGGAWVILTITAMLGLGEHFLADVAITIPFAVAMRAVLATGAAMRARRIAFLTGAAFYFGWVGILRAPESVLANAWLLRLYGVAGVAAALWTENKLYYASTSGGIELPSPPLSPRVLLGISGVNWILALAAVVMTRGTLGRAVPVVLVIGLAAGAFAAKRVGPILANIGLLLASSLAFVGVRYVPDYLADFDLVSWGEAVLWLAGDALALFLLGPLAFFIGAAGRSVLGEVYRPART